MGWEGEITSLLPVDVSCPAPGQGALAVEARVAPDAAWEIVSSLDDVDIRQEVDVERSFLRGLGGGCTTPIGAHAKIERMHGIATVRFWGMLASDDGSRLQRIYEEYPLDVARDRAFESASRLLREVAPKWSGVGARDSFAGLSVMVTGSDSQAEPLIDRLRERGADPHRMRTIDILPIEDDSSLREAMDTAMSGEVDWVVLTSPNAVGPMDAVRAGREIAAKIAVVGSRTAEVLRDAGVEPDLVSGGPGAVELVQDLKAAEITGKKVLCLLSDKARPTLVNGLIDAGAEVRVVAAYRNEPIDLLDDETRDLVRAGRVDVITFASPTAVASFRRLVGPDLPAMSGSAFFAIGPTTANALREAGLPVHGEATTQDPAGFINAIEHYFGQATQSEEIT
jgi:uroporphyrinogen-III synthase